MTIDPQCNAIPKRQKNSACIDLASELKIANRHRGQAGVRNEEEADQHFDLNYPCVKQIKRLLIGNT